jgi:hypothetical protein
MIGKIVIYRIYGGTNATERNLFCQHFFGQETSSHQGKYRYRRKGLLDHIPHRKLIRGVLIIPSEYSGEVVEFLDRYNAEVYIRDVVLTSNDVQMLELIEEV